MKKYAWLTFLLMLVFLETGCAVDTCNGELGNTFDTIDYDSIVDTNESVHFSWNVLEELPESYFKDHFFPNDEETEDLLASFEANKTNLTLFFAENALPEPGNEEDYLVGFRAGDRETVISCEHKGRQDAYVLEMAFTISNEMGSYELTDFFWLELFIPGAF